MQTGSDGQARNLLLLRSPGRIVDHPEVPPWNAASSKARSRPRSAQKPGIVRYVLAVSLVLVVILFLVAYTISV
jgi:hypothetical protein